MTKDELQKKCDDLDIKYQENDTTEQLKLMIDGVEAKEKIKILEAENEELVKITEELNDKVEELTSSKKKKNPVIKIGKKKYEQVIPKFRHPEKGVITHEELKADKELQKDLLKRESGVLKEIEE